ncbi:MAG: hypothetical protein N3A70_05365 [Anoxybacillus gonensis]|nr:hypothetical protein [Anoxybacillus gonensis]
MGTGIVRSVLRNTGGKPGNWVADQIDVVLGPPSRSGSSLSKKIREEDEYDPESARLEETRRINEALREYTRSLEDHADRLEERCLATCQEYIRLIVKDIEAINNRDYKGKKLNINLNRLERQLRDIEKSVKGTIKKKLSKRVSINDSECLRILKMEKGSDKESAMKQFADRVFKDALLELSENVRDVVLAQCDYVIEQMEDRLETITSSLENMMEQVAHFEELKERDEARIEEEKCDIYLKLSMSETAMIVLEETVAEKVLI